MTRAELLALAERVEHAAGADRALDAAEREATTAGKIATFLRALPVTRSPTLEECQKARTTNIRPRINYSPDLLAAAVEAAAKEQRDAK